MSSAPTIPHREASATRVPTYDPKLLQCSNAPIWQSAEAGLGNPIIDEISIDRGCTHGPTWLIRYLAR
jgi:hypothetical protein